MKTALLLIAVLVAIVWQAPATLVDLAVRRASGGEVRLAPSEGTLWHGRGAIEVADRPTQSWQPWREIEWEFDATALLRAHAGWEIASENTSMGRLEISPTGWSLAHLSISGPAKFFWQRIPHELGRLGWVGDVTMASPGINCTWRLTCAGRLEVRWINAASNFLPNRPLGDYLIELTGASNDVTVVWRTLRGQIRIDGEGSLSTATGQANLEASIVGDPILLQHLTAVAGPWAKPGGKPGVWKIVFHSRPH